MTTVSPRPEHVFAAAWASSYLRELGVTGAQVRANGVLIVDPEAQADALRARYASEPQKTHLITKVFTSLLALRKRVARWFTKTDKPEVLALPPPKTRWQFENVGDTVHLHVQLPDGRDATLMVPFVRRDESIQLLTMSSIAMFGAMVMFLPGGGNVVLIPGALIALTTAGRAYMTADVRHGNAGVRTAAKLVGLGLVDCIPVVATASLTAGVLGAQTAIARYRLGQDLIDTTAAEPLLRMLAGASAALAPPRHFPIGADLRGVAKLIAVEPLSST